MNVIDLPDLGLLRLGCTGEWRNGGSNEVVIVSCVDGVESGVSLAFIWMVCPGAYF